MGSPLLFRYNDAWSDQIIADVLEAMEDIAVNDLGLSVFTNQVTIVPDIGMLDAYANHGMPHMYPHWSFGKRWKQMELDLKNGDMGLAYELVVPTDPCISWNMASNGMGTMALVIAHAAFGHNHVFKNNYLFKKWTHSSTLADYCRYARDAILEFEKQYGVEEVEETLDAAHALSMPCGVFFHGEPPPFDLKEEKKRLAARMRAVEANIDPELIDTVPGLADKLGKIPELGKDGPQLPEENILYFLERYSPRLPMWKREVIRIVRTITQQTAFPSAQTKTLNEGAAVFVHNYIINKLYQQGRLDEGTMIGLAKMNSGVLYQPDTRDFVTKDGEMTKMVGRFNPYALGFGICKEIVRIAGFDRTDAALFTGLIDDAGPSAEDKRWFKFAGQGDWRGLLRDAWANYRDDSFIEQFLSPRMMREWKLFALREDLEEGVYVVTDTTHERTMDETGYEAIRHRLAGAHAWNAYFPDVAVTAVDLLEDRHLTLRYTPRQGMDLEEENAYETCKYVALLWGYKVEVVGNDGDTLFEVDPEEFT